MRENNTMQLSDTTPRSAAAAAFYDRFCEKIADIEEEVRRNPQDRNELSRFYELLKVKCWEV